MPQRWKYCALAASLEFSHSLDRREEFEKLLKCQTGETHRVADFKGTTVSLPILRVPLNLPKYRISNGRTASAQQEYVATKCIVQADFFDNGDPELEDIQIAQHHILRGMVNEEGLLAKFKDPINKQVEPIILNENGFIVNGNRRICCWRMLHEGDTTTYSHFGHIDVVVLPHCDEKELDRLEAKLQIEKDIRSDYTWDSEANMMEQKLRLHGFTTIELAQLYGKTKKEVDDLLEMRRIADDYLTSRNKKNAWSEVKDSRFAFQELIKAMATTTLAGDKEIVKQASFALIDDPTKAGERLYAVIPKVKEHLVFVKENLFEAFPLKAPEEDKDAEEAFGTPQLFPSQSSKRSEMALVAEMKKDEASVNKARDIVIETIRSQDDLSKERKNADFLLKAIRRANGLIQNAASHLRPEYTALGVKEHLENIKTSIVLIESWLLEQKG